MNNLTYTPRFKTKNSLDFTSIFRKPFSSAYDDSVPGNPIAFIQLQGGVLTDSVGQSSRPNRLRQSIYFNGASTDYVAMPLTGSDIDEVRGVLRVATIPTATRYVFGSKGSAQRFMISIGTGGNVFGSLGDNTSVLGVVGGVYANTDIYVSLKDNGDNTGTLTVGEAVDTETFSGDTNNSQNLYVGAVNNNGSFLGGHQSYWHSLEFYSDGVLVAAVDFAERTNSTTAIAFDKSFNGNSGTVFASDLEIMLHESLAFGNNRLELSGDLAYSELSGVI